MLHNLKHSKKRLILSQIKGILEKKLFKLFYFLYLFINKCNKT